MIYKLNTGVIHAKIFEVVLLYTIDDQEKQKEDCT